MNENRSDSEKITSFLKDLSSAESKLGFKNTLNVFDAAGLGRQEIKHSKMLSFFLDPSKGHCLGDKILNEIILNNFDSISSRHPSQTIRPTTIFLNSIGDLYVHCEWKNIDIIAYSEILNFILIIENKVDAKESSKDGTSQLNKYANIIESDPKFANFSKLYLYLTIDGEEPTDKRWSTITHQDILGYLESSLYEVENAGIVTSEAKFFIKNYIDFLRKNIVTNPILENECRTIYQRHKELIDIIIQFTGADSGVSEFADEFSSRTNSQIYGNRSGKFAYIPNSLVNILPDNLLDKPWWGQSKPLLFWFFIDEKKQLKLILQVGPIVNKELRKNFISDLIEKLGLTINRKIKDQYTVLISHAIKVDMENDILLEQMINLHHKLDDLFEKIESTVTAFNFHYSEP